jgi:hypothetical protein
MTDEPRRFRVILDTCDIVRSEPKREVWPESEAPSHSIFDQRHLSKHHSLTRDGRIRNPSKTSKDKSRNIRTPVATEPCDVCHGEGQIYVQVSPETVAIRPCKRCGRSGEQMKFPETKITCTKERHTPKPPKTYSYRRLQEHMSHGDPCTLCGQSAAEHRPNREAVKKEREGK